MEPYRENSENGYSWKEIMAATAGRSDLDLVASRLAGRSRRSAGDEAKRPARWLLAIPALAAAVLIGWFSLVDRAVPESSDAEAQETAHPSEPLPAAAAKVGAVPDLRETVVPSPVPAESKTQSSAAFAVRARKLAGGTLVEWSGSASASYELQQCWLQPGLEMCENHLVAGANRWLDLGTSGPRGLAVYRVRPATRTTDETRG